MSSLLARMAIAAVIGWLAMLSKSDYLETQILNWLKGTTFPAAPANVYVSLHTADPGETGASEHGATAGYVRKIIGFTGTGPLSNAAIVAFAQASANYSAQITHFGVWDALSGGNFLGGNALTTARTISTGDIPQFAAGALTWTED